MGGSLVGQKEITKLDLSTLFIYNFAVAFILSLSLIISAPYIAKFYDTEKLKPILYVMSGSVLISSLGKVQNIILIRNLKFKTLSYISIISSAISAGTAIILGFSGYGVWALVMQSVVLNIMIVILQFFQNKYIPQLKFSTKSFKRQWAFGVHLFFSQSLQTIYNNIFLIIFPKISSLSFSGLYSQANKLQQLPIGLFTTVLDGSAFPVLSKIEDENQLKLLNRNIISKFYYFTFSFFFLLSLVSKDLIAILLGQKWLEATPILSILSISGIFLMIMVTSRNTLKSMNKTHIISRLEVYKTVIGVIILIATITLFNSEIIIIWGILIASILSSIITLIVIAKNTNYQLKEQLKDIASPISILFLSYIFSELILQQVNLQYIISFLLSIFLYSFFTIILALIMHDKTITYYLRTIFHKRNNK